MRKNLIIGGVAILIATSATAAIQPGEWRSTTQMADIQLPAEIPAQIANMVRDQMSKAITTTQCITQEDIDQSPEQMFQQSGGQCRYSTFEMDNGIINSVAVCDVEGNSMTMTMRGTYTDTTFTMSMNMQGDAGMGQTTMTYNTSGERLGNCG